MNEQGDSRVISAYVYSGAALEVVKALHEAGFQAAHFRGARGSAVGDQARLGGVPREFEKDILSVLVPASEVDRVLVLIFEAAKIDRIHGGFLVVERVRRASRFVLPALQDEGAQAA